METTQFKKLNNFEMKKVDVNEKRFFSSVIFFFILTFSFCQNPIRQYEMLKEITGYSFRQTPKSSLKREDVKSMIVKNNFHVAYAYVGVKIPGIYDGAGFPNELAILGGGSLIMDRKSDLMWKRRLLESEFDFQIIRLKIDSLNRIKYGGYQNWRIPTLPELMSLMEPNPNGCSPEDCPHARIEKLFMLNNQPLGNVFSADQAPEGDVSIFPSNDPSDPYHWIVQFYSSYVAAFNMKNYRGAKIGILPVRSGDNSHPLIKEAQQILIMLKYEAGKPDGIWGAKTLRALQKFQRDQNISITNKIDEKTIAALRYSAESLK